MENRKHILSTLAMVFIGLALVIASAIAQDKVLRSPYFSDAKLYQIETNLIVALQSGYPGIESSAAQTLRELKAYNPGFSFSRSIIPLMRIVKSETADTRSRLCTILALYDLKSDRGDFAIAGMAKYSANQKVKKLCSWFMYTRQLEKTQVTVNTIQKTVLLALW
ncbi:MAG: hypothetical protein ABSB78_10520 [Bacteroidota bacterium]